MWFYSNKIYCAVILRKNVYYGFNELTVAQSSNAQFAKQLKPQSLTLRHNELNLRPRQLPFKRYKLLR